MLRLRLFSGGQIPELSRIAVAGIRLGSMPDVGRRTLGIARQHLAAVRLQPLQALVLGQPGELRPPRQELGQRYSIRPGFRGRPLFETRPAQQEFFEPEGNRTARFPSQLF